MRRGRPEGIVAVLMVALLASYVWYTSRVVAELRVEAQRNGQMLAIALRGIADTNTAGQTIALAEVLRTIRESRVPIIVRGPYGDISLKANLPFDPGDSLPLEDRRVAAYIPKLAAQHQALSESAIGTVYYGDSKLVDGLRVIPALQAITGALLLLAFIYIVRTRSSADRERLWAGMARESAHQLGTPLSSLTGWIELLEDRSEQDPSLAPVISHMRGDLLRLDRVAHRFERIGHEPRFDDVDVGGLVERIAAYFRARVPQLANTIRVDSTVDTTLTAVKGDPVLLEWALEVLTRNAIDALAGRGGTVSLSAGRTDDDGVRIRVADDGPGIARENRERVFEPGFSTKQGGWGIGLSLAKRIVEENHGGKLALVPSDRGATFEIILH